MPILMVYFCVDLCEGWMYDGMGTGTWTWRLETGWRWRRELEEDAVLGTETLDV